MQANLDAIVPLELFPAQSTSTGANGTCVDLQQYQGIVKVILDAKTGGTGTLNMKIQTGDASDGSDAADFSPAIAFTQITTTGGLQALSVDTRAAKRYIRAVSTIGTGPQVFAVLAVGEKKIY